MQNNFFSHQSVSQRLAKKLQDWYKVSTEVIHNLDKSSIIVNGLTFTVSRCKQFDKHNGQFSLTHNSKLIEVTQMYSLVNNTTKNK
jgi:hypothetical protein